MTITNLPPLVSMRCWVRVLAAAVAIVGVLPPPATAAVRLSCTAPSAAGVTLTNQVSYSYTDGATVALHGLSSVLTGQVTTGGSLRIVPQGIYDSSGSLFYTFGTIAASLQQMLQSQGWSQAAANSASIAAVQAFANLPADSTMDAAALAISAAIDQAVPSQSGASAQPSATRLMGTLIGLAPAALQSLGLTTIEAERASSAATAVIATSDRSRALTEIVETVFADAARAVPVQSERLADAQRSLVADRSRIQAGTSLPENTTLRFQFSLSNAGSAPIAVQPPTPSTIQPSLPETAIVTAVELEGALSLPESIELAPQQQISLWVQVRVSSPSDPAIPLAIGLENGCGGGAAQQALLLLSLNRILSPTDAVGQVTGCDGAPLTNYQNMQVALYRPAAGSTTGEVRDLLRLAGPPNRSGDRAGAEPALNSQNSNPFLLTSRDRGRYRFGLTRQQIRPGQVYVLVVSPPPDSSYSERRIRLEIGERTAAGFAYTATSLDGRSIQATDRRTSIRGTLRAAELAAGGGLSLLGLDVSICQTEALQIVKTGDRAAAEPGDTVVYRLLVRNLATSAIDNLAITDVLPLGLRLIEDSVRAERSNDRRLPVTTRRNGDVLIFELAAPLPVGEVLSLTYAARLTPDAVRGTGQNAAVVRGRRSDNGWIVRDGPSVHRLRVEPGILSDCGTLIGRVFIDRNFDGEQQPHEAGVPNAVVYLDDGNRITTDDSGLFSVANVLPGYRTGALDLTSLPDYVLAPNHYAIERNSPARLVHLAPGSMARMNFAVMPAPEDRP